MSEQRRVAECPDQDSTLLRRIEVDFAIPVEMTQSEQRRLVLLLSEIIDAPWNQIEDGVHWLAGVGSKPNWSRADAGFLGIKAEDGAPVSGEPTFDDSVFHVESCARGFVSEKEKTRTLRRREKPEIPPQEKPVFQAVVDALQAVAFFWGSDPKAFGDEATLNTIASRFEPVARKCRKALALLWEHDAKRTNEEGEDDV